MDVIRESEHTFYSTPQYEIRLISVCGLQLKTLNDHVDAMPVCNITPTDRDNMVDRRKGQRLAEVFWDGV